MPNGTPVIANRVASVVLLFSLLSSYKIDLYFGTSIFFDSVAILMAAIPFALCIVLRARVESYAMSLGVLFLILLLCMIWGLTFSARQPVNPLIAALTLRSWLYFMLVPTVYVMHQRGFSAQSLFNIFRWSLYIAILLTAYLYFTLDLEVMKKSGNPEVANLVRWDPTRGYRLILLHMVTTAGVMCAALSVCRRERPITVHLAVLAVGGVMLAFGYSRVILLCLAGASVLFVLFRLTRIPRITGWAVSFAISVYLFTCSELLPSFLRSNLQDVSARARLSSLERASPIIADYPIFGYGQQISSQLSYEDIFGKGFAPSDLGTTGIIFRFGYLGLACYALIAVLSFLGAWRLWESSRKTIGPPAATLPIIVIMMVLASFSVPGFVSGDGVAIAAIAIGFGSIKVRTRAAKPSKAHRAESAALARGRVRSL